MLKSLLEALFKLSGGQAMPGTVYSSFNQNIQPEASYSYTAPCDGYFVASVPSSYYWVAIRISGVDRFTMAPQHGIYESVCVPVKKGDAISVVCGEQRSTSATNFQITMRMYKTVGAS